MGLGPYPTFASVSGEPTTRFESLVSVPSALATGASATCDILNPDLTDSGEDLDDCFNETLVELQASSICWVFKYKGKRLLFPAQLNSCPVPTNINP